MANPKKPSLNKGDWYAIVQFGHHKPGRYPKIQVGEHQYPAAIRGPYKGKETAERALADYQDRLGESAEEVLRATKPTIVGPFVNSRQIFNIKHPDFNEGDEQKGALYSLVQLGRRAGGATPRVFIEGQQYPGVQRGPYQGKAAAEKALAEYQNVLGQNATRVFQLTKPMMVGPFANVLTAQQAKHPDSEIYQAQNPEFDDKITNPEGWFGIAQRGQPYQRGFARPIQIGDHKFPVIPRGYYKGKDAAQAALDKYRESLGQWGETVFKATDPRIIGPFQRSEDIYQSIDKWYAPQEIDPTAFGPNLDNGYYAIRQLGQRVKRGGYIVLWLNGKEYPAIRPQAVKSKRIADNTLKNFQSSLGSRAAEVFAATKPVIFGPFVSKQEALRVKHPEHQEANNFGPRAPLPGEENSKKFNKGGRGWYTIINPGMMGTTNKGKLYYYVPVSPDFAKRNPQAPKRRTIRAAPIGPYPNQKAAQVALDQHLQSLSLNEDEQEYYNKIFPFVAGPFPTKEEAFRDGSEPNIVLDRHQKRVTWGGYYTIVQKGVERVPPDTFAVGGGTEAFAVKIGHHWYLAIAQARTYTSKTEANNALLEYKDRLGTAADYVFQNTKPMIIGPFPTELEAKKATHPEEQVPIQGTDTEKAQQLWQRAKPKMPRKEWERHNPGSVWTWGKDDFVPEPEPEPIKGDQYQFTVPKPHGGPSTFAEIYGPSFYTRPPPKLFAGPARPGAEEDLFSLHRRRSSIWGAPIISRAIQHNIWE